MKFFKIRMLIVVVIIFSFVSTAMIGCSAVTVGSKKDDLPKGPVDASMNELSYCEIHSTDLPFAGGDGSPADPYILCSPQQFLNMNTQLSAHFELGADLDFEGVTYSPIGPTSALPFTGTINGKGYQLKNISYHYSGPNWSGVFGNMTSGAVIEDIHIKDCFLTASSGSLGGIVGLASDSATEIRNSSITGCSIVGPSYVGGITAFALQNASLSNIAVNNDLSGSTVGGGAGSCQGSAVLTGITVHGSVSSSITAGGICGALMTSAEIHQSFSNALVNGTNSVGGLVGSQNDTTLIINSMSAGLVSGTQFVGGITGNMSCAIPDVIAIDSYSYSVIRRNTGIATSFGSVTGNIDPDCQMINVPEITDIQTINYVPAAALLNHPNAFNATLAQIRNPVTLAAWDFLTVWDRDATGLPILR